MTYICDLCQFNASQSDSFICSDCDASHTLEYDYNPTLEEEREVEIDPNCKGDHTPDTSS